jgi:hypothetical protein
VKGNTIKKLTTSEYNHYKLPANHHYDYHEFRSSELTNSETEAIQQKESK